MDKKQFLMWLAFKNTGTIEDYLKYRFVGMDLEAGEEFGFIKDNGHRAEDDKIR